MRIIRRVGFAHKNSDFPLQVWRNVALLVKNCNFRKPLLI